ncbi:MAG: hypothetical protein ABIY70_25155 [Capsulimonas sp.]|uniref:hypothetical protein n=1 Tax=Capsulimonas sp. TaxID=2494211 RepID=UPI00326369B2
MLLTAGTAAKAAATDAAPDTSASLNFDARHTQDVASNPEGVTCVLRLPNSKTEFHMGEVIPLEATIAWNKEERYRYCPERETRVRYGAGDEFIVDREEDAPDPLGVYFASLLNGGYSGPGHSWQTEGSKPFALEMLLNNWRRFDKAGVYRIYLRTNRVQLQKPDEDTIYSLGPMRTASNAVSIEILPSDPAWSSQTLAKELPRFVFTQDGGKGSADVARTIRLLDTPESIQAIVDRWAKSIFPEARAIGQNESYLGLMGSRRRSYAIERMQVKMQDRDASIGDAYISGLSELQAFDRYPDITTPGFVKWEIERKRNKAKYEFLQQNLIDLWKTFRQKRGAARTQTAFTLFLPRQYVPKFNPARKMLGEILTARFASLPQYEQTTLLGDNVWPQIRSPKMLKPLYDVYRNLPSIPNSTQTKAEAEEYQKWRRDPFFQRINDLDPAEGRRIILEEIQSAHPRLSADTLTTLPDAALPPSVEAKLVSNLEKSGDAAPFTPLVSRYATQASLPRLQILYHAQRDRWTCEAQSELLAYFLRVEPYYGAAEIKDVLTQRKNKDCYQNVFTNLIRVMPLDTKSISPQLERAAIDALNDPDRFVAADAAKLLGRLGSLDAEPEIWALLRRLQALGQSTIDDGSRQYVADALASSPVWLITHRQLEEIRGLFPDSGDINHIFVLSSVDSDDHIYLYGDQIHGDGQDEVWRIGQYTLNSRAELLRRLAQYPKGTIITLNGPLNPLSSSPDALTTAQLEKIVSDLQAVLLKQGVQLERGK